MTLEGEQHIGTVRPSDVLVIWNRYGRGDSLARNFEQAGAAVIVAENGFLGAAENDHAKPFASAEMRPERHLYALALGNHNGAGKWWIGERGRWRKQGIALSPWRTDGSFLLVLPQRGIGPPGVAMPRDWPAKTLARLQAMTDRPVRLRAHPGNAPATKPLAADLEGAWAVVTWGSGSAIKAICAGVPAFCDFRLWIGAPAASQLGDSIEAPLRCDDCRERMLDRLAWHQWEISEISTGLPFRRLLELHQAKRQAAA